MTHVGFPYHAGLFAGAALYISAVEHPAAMDAGVGNFYKFFPHMYKRYVHSSASLAPSSQKLFRALTPLFCRAAPMQGSLAIVGSTAAAIAASKGGHCSKFMWGGAGVLLAAVWPFTVLAMMPTNNKIKLQVRKDSRRLWVLDICRLSTYGSMHSILPSAGCHSLCHLALEHIS